MTSHAPGSSGLWILVVDAMRARIIRRAPVQSGRTQADLVMRSDMPNLRLVIDRNAESLGIDETGARLASLYRDEQSFLRQVIGLLEAHRSAGDFDMLAILAETAIAAQFDCLLPARLRETVVWQDSQARLDLSDPKLPAGLEDWCKRRGLRG